jgi:minor extracellular serine protease Vpr
LTSDSNARVTVNPSSVNLAAGEKSLAITVLLSGSRPAAGAYEGFLDVKDVKGAGPELHLPYFYVVGNGVPYDIFPIQNGSFTGVPNDFGWRIGLRLVDLYGVPVVGAQVKFQVLPGGGKINSAGGDLFTDGLGTAAAFVDLGPQQGDQIFTGTAGGLIQRFEGYARRYPVINDNGVVNAAASHNLGPGLAPGSYISLYGSDLSDTTLAESTQSLPLSLGQVSVSFDGGGKSLPGHIHFVSPGQTNVQIPWEFQGQSSVQMKVTNYGLWSDLYTVPLATYSPGIFVVTDAAYALISAANPAKRGGSIIIWANGLGPVTTPQSSGDPASSTDYVYTNTAPTVTLGGNPATVPFSGLTPDSVGLYQVNVSVPSDAPTGTQPLKLSIGGQDVTVNVVVQ